MRTNERGNQMETAFFNERDRYHYDFEQCTTAKGWEQYDTSQDAWYFGVWVHLQDRKVMTYAEGDETLVTCPTVESFKAELDDMARCYGPVPPAFKTIDTDTGILTEHFAPRPTV